MAVTGCSDPPCVVGGSTPLEASQKRAAALRMKLGIVGRADVQKIAQLFGAVVSYETLRFDAVLTETLGGFNVCVNSGSPATRRRFSIAHELGHLDIYRLTQLREALSHSRANEAADQDADEVERICDAFAAEILMPAREWSQLTNKAGLSIAVVRKLLRIYDVSLDAGIRRLIDVSPWIHSFIVWTAVRDGASFTELRPRSFLSMRPRSAERLRNLIVGSDAAANSPVRALDTRQVVAGPLRLYGESGMVEGCAESVHLYPYKGDVLTLVLQEPEAQALQVRFKADASMFHDVLNSLGRGNARLEETTNSLLFQDDPIVS